MTTTTEGVNIKAAGRSLTDEEIESRLTYHSPSPAGRLRHEALAAAFTRIMTEVDFLVPNGREKSIVFTHLEEAKMMASAGVARNKETV